jgi:hypothetical protein
MIAITLTHGGVSAHACRRGSGIISVMACRASIRDRACRIPRTAQAAADQHVSGNRDAGGAGVLALGATGGTRIPNSVCEVLLNYVG